MVFPCVSCVRLRPGVPLACLISVVFSLCGFVSALFFGLTALPVPMPRQVHNCMFWGCFCSCCFLGAFLVVFFEVFGYLFGSFLAPFWCFFGHFFDVFAGVGKKVLPRWFLEVFWPPLTLANLCIP